MAGQGGPKILGWGEVSGTLGTGNVLPAEEEHVRWVGRVRKIEAVR